MCEISGQKARLRAEFLAVRSGIPEDERAAKDERIARKILALAEYTRSEMLLAYIPVRGEADTWQILRHALSEGKIVGAPRVLTGGEIAFFRIREQADLVQGTFGLSEPDPVRCERLTGFRKSLCIVPGLAFDGSRQRLGYGKGYYDRFLRRYSGVSAGICYRECLCERLPADAHDRAVDILVTDD